MTPYAELWCQSAFSLLEGASMPEDCVAQAAALGLRGLGLCDRDAVYGVPRAWKAAREHPGLDLLHGALLSVDDHQGRPGQELAVYAMDTQGWADLCELLSQGRHNAPKGQSRLGLGPLLERAGRLLALAGPGWAADLPGAQRLGEAFGDRLWVATARRLLPQDAREEAQARHLAQHLGRPIVAVQRALTHSPTRQRLQDVLTCIRLGCTLDQAGDRLQPNAERTLLGPEAMATRFADEPGWVERSLEPAEQAGFRLEQLRYHYPRELVPAGLTPMAWLRERVAEGMAWRFPEGVGPDLRRQLQKELALIEELDFPAYFLTVYDIVRFARSRGILCQGRGSAANSLVCFVLGITSVDPSQQHLLFERFISRERAEPPDIDVDFEHERREEVIQYIYTRYGRHRAAMVNEIISYRPRSAIRDVGKAMGLSLDQVDRLARDLDWWDAGAPKPERVAACGLDPSDRRVQLALELCGELHGLPRHLSIHVGGFVISEEPLRGLCPIEPAAMEARSVIQWDKDDVDLVNFVKVDVLALGTLTAIRKCFDLARRWHGLDLDLARVPREDPHVYEMLCRADSVGVFQVESRAQMSMLPRLQPRCFYDLVVEVSIVRPGPIQGGMVHPYLDRRTGRDPVVYAHPLLEPILERTLGVPIFQEQVMEMAMAVGGFSGGEADALRRAMGSWRKRGGLEALVTRLVHNMQEQGLSAAYAAQVARQILGFGEYGFPESHAASFALLVYVTAWLRRYTPAAFTCALINAQPMGFYSPRSLVEDARRHGVEVRPIDLQVSTWDCTLEPDGRADPRVGGRGGVAMEGVALRLGLRLVQGLGQEAAERVEAARAQAPFTDLGDLATRAGLDRGELMALARADALRGFGQTRRQAAWAVAGLRTTQAPLLAALSPTDHSAGLPEATALEELQQDLLATGLSLERHPIGLARGRLDTEGVLRIADLAHYDSGERVQIAGIVTSRQRPGTASGVLFMTLEDETGMANLVVWPKLYEAQRRTIRHEPLLVVRGRLQREGDAVSVLAEHFRPVGLEGIHPPSRDFH